LRQLLGLTVISRAPQQRLAALRGRKSLDLLHLVAEPRLGVLTMRSKARSSSG
jgi:hypothetical protein